jgi:hypothetical protein
MERIDMAVFLKLFDVIPGWVYALACAALVALLGVQTVRLDGSKVEVAQLHQQAEKDRADRAQLEAAHNLQIADMQAKHAATQQEIISGYTDLHLKTVAERDAALHRADGVHVAAEAAAGRDRAASPSDPAACERLRNENAALNGLVDQGYRLVVEGRSLVRDAASGIETLKAVIENDRKLLEAKP